MKYKIDINIKEIDGKKSKNILSVTSKSVLRVEVFNVLTNVYREMTRVDGFKDL